MTFENIAWKAPSCSHHGHKITFHIPTGSPLCFLPRSRRAFTWIFLSNGFYCTTFPYKPVLCRALDSADTFTVFSVTELRSPFKVIVELAATSFPTLHHVHAGSYERWPFLDSVSVLWRSFNFLIIELTVPTRTTKHPVSNLFVLL